MKAHAPGLCRPGDSEPPPLPPPPPAELDDDHYFDDDDEPSWWSTIRPISAVQPAEVAAVTPRASEPPAPRRHAAETAWVDRREAALPARPRAHRRARTAEDDASAATHALRVRARLSPDEQLAFDELMRGPAATDIVTMLVNQSEDGAVERLRRRLGDEPTAAEAARRAVSERIAALAALLSAPEQARALAGLALLGPEELAALRDRLAELSPPEAAALIRTYLAPRR